MMHNYPKLRSDLQAEGFDVPTSWRIARLIETRDTIIEHAHARECKDNARMQMAIEHYSRMLDELRREDRICELDAMHIFGQLREIEWRQRQQLLDTGSREKSILIATILKYFCGLSVQQILMVEEILDPPKNDVEDFMDGLVIR